MSYNYTAQTVYGMHTAMLRVENSAHVSSCYLNFVLKGFHY